MSEKALCGKGLLKLAELQYAGALDRVASQPSLDEKKNKLRADFTKSIKDRGLSRSSVYVTGLVDIEVKCLEEKLLYRVKAARDILLEKRPIRKQKEVDLILSFVKPMLESEVKSILACVLSDGIVRYLPPLEAVVRDMMKEFSNNYLQKLSRDSEIEMGRERLGLGTLSLRKKAWVWCRDHLFSALIISLVVGAFSALFSKKVFEWFLSLFVK